MHGRMERWRAPIPGVSPHDDCADALCRQECLTLRSALEKTQIPFRDFSQLCCFVETTPTTSSLSQKEPFF